MIRKTNIEKVREQLSKKGYVTNVWAFEHYVLRLGDIIFKLRKAGWDITGNYVPKTKNWKYKLLAYPLK